MNLLDARLKLAAALAPVGADDPDVHADYVDAVSPPALLVTWADPWLEADTACLYASRPQVIAIAGRLEPGAGVATLEALVSYVVVRLAADPDQWPIASVTSPRVFEIGGVSYLGARVEMRVKLAAT